MPSAHPLAYCPTCKKAFPIAAGREGATFVVRNSTTNCPNGHFARILNAHYQAFETEARGALEALSRGAHSAAWSLWDRLSRGETSPEQAQAEAERIKPGLGAVLNAASFADPTRKAILEVLFNDLVARPGPDDEPSPVPQDVTVDVPPDPEALREMQEKRKGGNRAFQRWLRHKQRVLMNPRVR